MPGGRKKELREPKNLCQPVPGPHRHAKTTVDGNQEWRKGRREEVPGTLDQRWGGREEVIRCRHHVCYLFPMSHLSLTTWPFVSSRSFCPTAQVAEVAR